MLDGRPLIDVHLQAARIPTLKPSWQHWAHDFGDTTTMQRVYDDHGTIRPEAFEGYLAEEGVDIAVLLCEYSPKATGIQPIKDVLAVTMPGSSRIRVLANVNPHLHYPVVEERQRQVSLGAIGLKVHPVHAGFPVNDRVMYPPYEFCRAAGLPLVVHCGTSTFDGMIFGTDWPGVPGVALNARVVASLLGDDDAADLVLWRNGANVYNLKLEA